MQKDRNTGKDVSATEHSLAVLHELGDGVLTIPDTFLELRRDKRDCFRLVQFKSSSKALLRKKASLGDTDSRLASSSFHYVRCKRRT